MTVTAEWAWRGKLPSDRDYRLLACSAGSISPENFEAILDRFSPGTLEDLPQVTVSYVGVETGHGYLGIGIHEPEDGGYDKLGRDVVFTRYFCVPYDELAAAGVTYQDMYAAFEHVKLSDGDRATLTVEVPRREPGIPTEAPRLLPVAEMLLTGNPVCILEAERSRLAERLGYIDDVMSLLPYGARAEMAAATWTSSTFRGHKFRLYFSSARREPIEPNLPDHLVSWHENDQVKRTYNTKISSGFAEGYREWVEPQLGPPLAARLAGMLEPMPFKAADVLKMVNKLTEQRQAPSPRQQDSGAQQGTPMAQTVVIPPPSTSSAQAQVPQTHARPGDHPADEIEGTLLRCARCLENLDLDGVKSCVKMLRASLELPRNSEHRRRYQELITGKRMLSPGFSLDRQETGYYKVMLQTAFGKHIDYETYCRIEDMTGTLPHRTLLQAMEEIGFSSPRAALLVQYHLGNGKHVRTSPDELVRIVASDGLRREHSRVICEVTVGELAHARKSAVDIARSVLHSHGYLAPVLDRREPHDLNYKVGMLTKLLAAAYSDVLDPLARQDILAQTRHTPTLALFLAVCQLTRPEDAHAVCADFLLGLGASQELGGAVRESAMTRALVLSRAQPSAPARPEHEMGTFLNTDKKRERTRIRTLLNPASGRNRDQTPPGGSLSSP